MRHAHHVVDRQGVGGHRWHALCRHRRCAALGCGLGCHAGSCWHGCRRRCWYNWARHWAGAGLGAGHAEVASHGCLIAHAGGADDDLGGVHVGCCDLGVVIAILAWCAVAAALTAIAVTAASLSVARCWLAIGVALAGRSGRIAVQCQRGCFLAFRAARRGALAAFATTTAFAAAFAAVVLLLRSASIVGCDQRGVVVGLARRVAAAAVFTTLAGFTRLTTFTRFALVATFGVSFTATWFATFHRTGFTASTFDALTAAFSAAVAAIGAGFGAAIACAVTATIAASATVTATIATAFRTSVFAVGAFALGGFGRGVAVQTQEVFDPAKEAGAGGRWRFRRCAGGRRGLGRWLGRGHRRGCVGQDTFDHRRLFVGRLL